MSLGIYLIRDFKEGQPWDDSEMSCQVGGLQGENGSSLEEQQNIKRTRGRQRGCQVERVASHREIHQVPTTEGLEPTAGSGLDSWCKGSSDLAQGWTAVEEPASWEGYLVGG